MKKIIPSNCEELITGNGKTYVLSSSVKYIEALSLVCENFAGLSDRLYNGELPPEEVQEVITHLLASVDGVPIKELNREEEAAEFVKDFGLQECSLLAQKLINKAIIGTVKSNQLARGEKVEGLTVKYKRHRSVIGWMSAGLLAGYAVLAYAVFR